MVDFTKIKELRDEINSLLQERPELKTLQKEIDIALRKAGDPMLAKNQEDKQRILHNRQAILQNMMLVKWQSILPSLEELKGSVEQIGEIAKGGLK